MRSIPENQQVLNLVAARAKQKTKVEEIEA